MIEGGACDGRRGVRAPVGWQLEPGPTTRGHRFAHTRASTAAGKGEPQCASINCRAATMSRIGAAGVIWAPAASAFPAAAAALGSVPSFCLYFWDGGWALTPAC